MLKQTLRNLEANFRMIVPLFIVLLVSGSAFIVFISATETTRVVADEVLSEYWRTSYDILIRPSGSTSLTEKEFDLVQGNYLSNVTGNITLEQLEAIREIPDVEVAAPIAILGYAILDVIQLLPDWLPATCLGLHGLEEGVYHQQQTLTVDDGVRTHTYRDEYFMLLRHPPLEVRKPYFAFGGMLQTSLQYDCYVLIAGIDPEAEAALVGLDKATIKGRYLGAEERVVDLAKEAADESLKEFLAWSGRESFRLPALLNAHNYVALRGHLRIAQLDATPEQAASCDDRACLEKFQETEVVLDQEADLTGSYEGLPQLLHSTVVVDSAAWSYCPEVGLPLLWPREPPGEMVYREINPPLPAKEPILEAIPVGKWIRGYEETDELAFRREREPSARERELSYRTSFSLDLKGVFDIEKLHLADNPYALVPHETYQPPLVKLKYDEAGYPLTAPLTLRPTLNPHSYILSPPVVLTTLKAACFVRGEGCISAIRVRVGSIEHLPPQQAQSKIEAVAGEIARRTGLQVDIMVGSSVRPVLVHIPGYEDIPPLGYVEEQWVQKGVNVTVTRGIAHDNLILFGLMLVVGGLYAFNATLNAFTARSREFGLLKAIGWRSVTVFAQVLGEVGLLGLLAGLGGILLGLLASLVLGLGLVPKRLLLIFPLNLCLSLLAGLYPAWRAGRQPPLVAIRRGDISVGWRRGHFSLKSYALRNLALRPRRLIAALATILLSVCLLILVLSVVFGARGYIQGTLLGDFVYVQIGGYHYIMIALCFGAAELAIAELLLTQVVERRAEIGVLKAVGWRNRQVAGLFVREGLLLGLAGGVLGWLAGLAAYGLLYQGLPAQAWSVTLPALGVPVLVGAVAAWYPARQAARVPPAEAVRYE